MANDPPSAQRTIAGEEAVTQADARAVLVSGIYHLTLPPGSHTLCTWPVDRGSRLEHGSKATCAACVSVHVTESLREQGHVVATVPQQLGFAWL